jgi:hypothetical protein
VRRAQQRHAGFGVAASSALAVERLVRGDLRAGAGGQPLEDIEILDRPAARSTSPTANVPST